MLTSIVGAGQVVEIQSVNKVSGGNEEEIKKNI